MTCRALDGSSPSIIPRRRIAEDSGGKFDYPAATGYINYQLFKPTTSSWS